MSLRQKLIQTTERSIRLCDSTAASAFLGKADFKSAVQRLVSETLLEVGTFDVVLRDHQLLDRNYSLTEEQADFWYCCSLINQFIQIE
jgi:hypothetical protein